MNLIDSNDILKASKLNRFGGNLGGSLVAKLAGDHRTRTFEIVRKPADQGEYEDSLITKYGMIYEKMREVIEDDTVL